jgi:DNA-binding MarR family transcriptional regulator/N-acetylglutamate synthase-like GNAT family acetyltransferase
MPGKGELADRVAVVRRFNRFYTRQIGVLNEGLLQSAFPLTQSRVLFELAHRRTPTASEIGAELGLDAGYLSRILRGLQRQRLVRTTRSVADGRQTLLSLTAKGRRAFTQLNRRSQQEVAAMLKPLPAVEQRRVVDAMRTVETALTHPAGAASYVLRPPQPGDLGWIVHRHGAIYAQEYGYDEEFEALVARIVAAFVERLDPKRERCWIAEKGGEIVGSVFLVKKSKTIAKLRLLLVEPRARGLGIGQRLVEECVRFARQARYRKITLWTQSDLHSARHLYKQAGFRKVHQERHHSFGHDLVAETWELTL